MDIMKDEGGQGAAEYILLFGGVIVIAVAALLIYRAYFTKQCSSKCLSRYSFRKSKCIIKKWKYNVNG